MEKVRVIYAARHDFNRNGFLKYVEEKRPDIEVVGLAGSAEELVRVAREKRADFIFSGYVYEDEMASYAIRKIRKFDKKVKIIVSTAIAGKYIGDETIKAGANHFFYRNNNFSAFIRCMDVYLKPKGLL